MAVHWKCKAAGAAGVLALCLGWTSPASAEDDTVLTETTGPNRALIRTGVAVFTLSYVPAFLVAATNTRRDDEYLYLPLAGPWLDLTHRDPCASCDSESFNKALLVTDGIFQAVGALEIVGSFFFMETRVGATAISKHKPASAKRIPVSITPSWVGGAYGVSATGAF
jgi:hypothetical protein